MTGEGERHYLDGATVADSRRDELHVGYGYGLDNDRNQFAKCVLAAGHAGEGHVRGIVMKKSIGQ